MKQLDKLLVITGFVLVAVVLFPAGNVLAAPGENGTRVPCPGSLATRLEIGMEGYVAQRFSSLRDVPAGNVIRTMYRGATFTVIDGPACGATLTHYKLDYGNGVVGWASESQIYSFYGNNQYWLAPSTVVATTTQSAIADGQGGAEAMSPVDPVNCLGSLPPRLEVGDTGRVARSYSTLRSVPAGPAMYYMTTGMTFTVLEGPVCAGYDDLVWYRIEYPGGTKGWASESQVNSPWGVNLYWLAPVG